MSGTRSGRPQLRPFVRALLSLLLALAWLHQPLALFAGTITVDGTLCTLPEAIGAANADSDADGCTISGDVGGEDTLLLAPTVHNIAPPLTGTTAAPHVATTIHIEGNGAVIQPTASGYRLFYVAPAGDLRIDGVILQNFLLADGSGGAIYNQGKFTLRNSLVISNATSAPATSGGAILSSNNATLSVSDSTILSNSAPFGGAIANYIGSTATLQGVTLAGNRATENGGALDSFDGSTLIIGNSAFQDNQAGEVGGAISSDRSELTVTAALFNQNEATGGGAIANRAGTVAITGTTFNGNEAVMGGGALLNSAGGIAHLSQSAFSANRAAEGGGMANEAGSTATFTDSDFTGNVAAKAGGALSNLSSSLAITTSTFMTNSAVDGGALYNGEGSTATLSSVDFIANLAQSGGAIHNQGGSTLDAGDSLFELNQGTVGGAIANAAAADLSLHSSRVLSNSAGVGGGVANLSGSAASFEESRLEGNAAITGGGVENSGPGSRVTMSATQLFHNEALLFGGAIANAAQGEALVQHGTLQENRAQMGAAIANTGTSTITISLTAILSNSAQAQGGALYNANGSRATLREVRLIENVAQGESLVGGIFATAPPTGTAFVSITQSCIVHNEEIAVATGESVGAAKAVPLAELQGNVLVEAANNWWGSPFGPGGDAPGSGDAIAGEVIFAPFLSEPLLLCPTHINRLGTQLPRLHKAP